MEDDLHKNKKWKMTSKKKRKTTLKQMEDNLKNKNGRRTNQPKST
jgi:hypothetical protein